MRANYDIVIVGGGMVGGLLACALGGGPFKVAVIDQAAPQAVMPPDYDTRVSAISLASQTMFQAVGAWDGMQRRRVSPVGAMHVWEGRPQRPASAVAADVALPPASMQSSRDTRAPRHIAAGGGRIEFNAADIGEPCLAYIIENSVIQAALLERLHQHTNLHHLCPVEVTDITLTDDDARVVLRDGRALHTRLLVGADGAQSAVRRAARIEAPALDLRQQSIVATVRCERPHAAIARQAFRATGPLALLPLDDAHHVSIVWSVDTERAQELMALAADRFVAELQAAFGDALGSLALAGSRAVFPLALSSARRYCAEHVALVGDAAHTVHPLAGQGVNLGFLDAAALAEVLTTAQAKQRDIGSRAVLRRYERWRKGENLAMVAVTGGFRYLFGSALPGVVQARSLGLRLTNAAAPIKNLIMRRASGLDGDLPRLARRAYN